MVSHKTFSDIFSSTSLKHIPSRKAVPAMLEHKCQKSVATTRISTNDVLIFKDVMLFLYYPQCLGTTSPHAFSGVAGDHSVCIMPCMELPLNLTIFLPSDPVEFWTICEVLSRDQEGSEILPMDQSTTCLLGDKSRSKPAVTKTATQVYPMRLRHHSASLLSAHTMSLLRPAKSAEQPV